MAQLDFTFIPTQSAASASGVTVDEIPEDVRKDVEAVYAALKANPQGRMRVTFANKTEALQWIAVASTYCKIRTEGPIRFRRSPTKNLPENVVDFRITDIPKNDTDAIRDAAAALTDTKVSAKPAK
jgi:hypothetical protein